MIYVDMDGCLAKWRTDASVEDTFKPDYFANLELEPKLKELIQMLRNSHEDVALLSSVYQEGTAKRDKLRFLDKHDMLDVPVVFVPYGEDKSKYVRSAFNVLIDDFSQNLRDWENAGYTGIKYYNGINGNHGTWEGYSINHKMPADKMFVVVQAVMNSLKS